MTWRSARLDSCCEIVSGGTPKTGVADYWDGDVLWATPRDLADLDGKTISHTPRKLTRAGLQACSATVLPVGSVLLSSRAPIGHVAINAAPMATNQGFKSLVPRTDQIDATFLYWWLRSNRPYLEGLGNGATFKEVSKAVVARIVVPVPPLGEQKRIGDILDRTDSLLAKRKGALARVEGLRYSLADELLGDLVSNSRKWPTLKLRDVCDVINDCPHTTPKWTSEGVVCLRTSNLVEGGWNWSDTRHVSESDYHLRSKRGYIVAGDIVLSREGTVGVAALVPKGLPMCLGQRLVQLRPSASHVSPEFLLHYLLLVLAPDRISRIMAGSTSKHLNLKDLRALPIPLPPIALQESFTRRLQAVQGVEASARRQETQLGSLLASLRQCAFRGEL